MHISYECLNAIEHKDPPIYCGPDYCFEMAPYYREYCHREFDPCNHPIAFFKEGQICWCCCCGPYALALAVADGAYRPIDHLAAGDSVLVSGRDRATWDVAPIASIGRLNAGENDRLAVRLIVRMADGSERHLALNVDALVMTSDGRLKPAGRTISGDELAETSGPVAEVRFAELVRADIAHPNMGPLTNDDDPLAGHLVDAFGLVVADLAVQTAAFAGKLPEGLVVNFAERSTEPLRLRDGDLQKQ